MAVKLSRGDFDGWAASSGCYFSDAFTASGVKQTKPSRSMRPILSAQPELDACNRHVSLGRLGASRARGLVQVKQTRFRRPPG